MVPKYWHCQEGGVGGSDPAKIFLWIWYCDQKWQKVAKSDQYTPKKWYYCNQLMTKFWTNTIGAIWWPNFELMQEAPFGDQIWNECKWRDLVTKLRTYSSGAICSPNLQPIQVVPLKSILNYSSWKIYSRYGVNTLGPLCLWQCFFCFGTSSEKKTVFRRKHSHTGGGGEGGSSYVGIFPT